MSPQETINILEDNLKRLVEAYQHVQEENRIMHEANQRMREELMRTHAEYVKLQDSYKHLQTAAALGGNAEDRQKAKRRITELIARIDQALALVKTN